MGKNNKRVLRLSTSLFFHFTIFISFSLATTTTNNNINNNRLVPGLYTFGDSLVDVGNNNHIIFSLIKANFPHNGIDFPTKKPTGRFCNGKNAVDFLSEKIGLPFSPPYLSLGSNLNKSNEELVTGVNFASGGSGIMDQTNKLFVLSLTKQVDDFIAVNKAMNERIGSSRSSQHFSKSLFLIVTGSNDIFGYFRSDDLRNKTTPAQYVNLMSNTIKGQIKRLYTLGARKFVIVGIGVIGCIPSERKNKKGEQCDQEINQLSIKYNEALKSMLKDLKFELNGINYSYFDGYGIMQNFIQNPTAYGFSEVKAACCGLGKLRADIPCLPFSPYCSNRSDHLFWDPSHPTEAAHRIFVDYLFDGPLQYTFPLNVKKLIVI